jgi:serine/threonine protein kinase
VHLHELWCGLCVSVYVLFFEGGSGYAIGQLCIDFVLLLYYGLLSFLPQQMHRRRPSLVIYSKCWLLFRVFGTALHIGFLLTSSHRFCSCAYYFFRIVLFCLFQPILSYKVLLLDTEWWQGICPESQSHLPGCEDVEFSLSSAQTLAAVMDQLNALNGSLFLNHSLITFHSDTLLGDGSFSQVVKGSYLDVPVAIKTIHTQDLTVEVIHKIAAEAKILVLLRRSPHVVFIHGLVLSPPSIFIVLELCAYGSLNNVLRGHELPSSTPSSEALRNRTISSPPPYSISISTQARHRPPLALSVPDMLFLALGAARGVHAIHSLSPLLCHRDIKSFNFLVCSDLTVKIADLELGADGSSPQDTPAGGGCRACFGSWGRGWCRKEAAEEITYSLQDELLAADISKQSALESEERPLQVHPSVLHMQATWLAPEVIPTGAFTQASDIYSLALVLWEIRTKRYPYSHCNHFQTKIRRAVVGGYREPFPAIPETDPFQRTLRDYDEIVRTAWDSDPRNRPSCLDLMTRLERLVQTCAAESMVALRNQTRHDESPSAAIGTDLAAPLPPPSSLSTSLGTSLGSSTRSSPHFPRLFESHGAEWAVVSATPPYHVLYLTASWQRSFGRLFPPRNVSLAALLGAPTEGETPSSVFPFVTSCLTTGYGHAVFSTLTSPRPTLSVHGYLFDSQTVQMASPEPTEPASVIAILFSNLTPHRDESFLRIPSRATTGPRFTSAVSVLVSQPGPGSYPSDRDRFDSFASDDL